jgi:phosphoribosylaminoimidazole-succinocarboxamide synthase
VADLIYEGSVKNIYEEIPASAERFGIGSMRFEGDPFSVFDYGEMPWQIDGKGEDLYLESLRFFRVLEDEGIPTHFTGDMGNREIGIFLARMLEYYEIIPGKSVIYRIPIECVYSMVVTPVSSLHGRLRSDEANPADYGLDHVPAIDEVVVLPATRTTYSTKIETTDVYKSLEEMAGLAGLVGNEAGRLDALTIAGAAALARDAEETGLILGDGKFEFVIDFCINFMTADMLI